MGAKKTEAPWGDRGEKGVSLCPPTQQKVSDRTYPLRRILGQDEATSPPKEVPGGVFPPKHLLLQRCTCGINLAYKRRTKAPEEEDGF